MLDVNAYPRRYTQRSPSLRPSYFGGTNTPVANTSVTTNITVVPGDEPLNAATTTTKSEWYEEVVSGWLSGLRLVAYVPKLTVPRPGTLVVYQVLNDGTNYDVLIGGHWLASSVNSWLCVPLHLQPWDNTSLTSTTLRFKVVTFVPTGSTIGTDSAGNSAITLYLQHDYARE